MRNAPVEADAKNSIPLIGGHRISPRLPWFRGEMNKKMELEAQTVIDFVKREMFFSEMSISLDVHSGFGVNDRIWYPYAKTKKDFPYKPEALKLCKLLDETLPHHIYQFECQADNYITSGDLWDYLMDEYYQNLALRNKVFLPLTLELGSWNWIRKNPSQFFSKLGIFNPIKEHRQSRIMRRHLLLLDFLIRATKNHPSWL